MHGATAEACYWRPSARRSYKAKAVAFAQELRSAWHIALSLLVLLAVLLTVGLVAVKQQAQYAQDRKLTDASDFAQSVLPLVYQPLVETSIPALQLATYISHNPGPALFTDPTSLKSLVDVFLAPITKGLISTVVLVYAGHPVLSYPAPGPQLSVLLSNLDMLNPGTAFPASVREETLYGIYTGDITRTVLSNESMTPDGLSMYIRLVPVFAAASNASDTWGWSVNRSASECISGALPCFNTTTGQKWWGQVMVVFNKTALMAPSLKDLETSGYGYLLQTVRSGWANRPPTIGPLATNDGWLHCKSPAVQGMLELSTTRAWQLQLCITNGWTVKWENPLYAVVVVVSVLLVALLAFAAQKWHAHSQLLKQLLPQRLIDRLDTHRTRHNSVEVPNLAGTPADRLIGLLHLLLEDMRPATQDVMQLLADVRQHQDFYTPDGLVEKLHQAAGMDDEVTAALALQLLGEPSLIQVGPIVQSSGNAIVEIAQGLQRTYTGLDTTQNNIIIQKASQPEQPHPDIYAALSSIMGFHNNESDSSLLVELPGASNQNPTGGTFMHHTVTGVKLDFCQVGEEESLSSSHTLSQLPTLIQAGYSCSQRLMTPNTLLDRLEQVLCSAMTLDGSFSAWELCEAAHNHPLSALGYWVFNQSGLLREYNIPSKPLINFLKHIESGYRTNPYHNRTHASDVLQSVHAILHQGGLRGTYADSFTVMACYLAAVCHDYEHRGVTNDYLVNTRHPIALRYNDRSPHENHHVAAAYMILARDDCNFLAHLPPADWQKLRKLIIDLVLATDMKQHFTLVGQFKSLHHIASTAAAAVTDQSPYSSTNKLSSPTGAHPAAASGSRFFSRPFASSGSVPQLVGTLGSAPRQSSNAGEGRDTIITLQDRPTAPRPGSPQKPCTPSRLNISAPMDGSMFSTGSVVMTPAPTPIDQHEQLLALQIMLKCCDIGHVCAALPIHLQWVRALEEEFFRQGDSEKALGLACSPLCDRQGQGIAKSQVGFLEVVVLPLLQSFTARFTAARPVLTAAMTNYKYWKSSTVTEAE